MFINVAFNLVSDFVILSKYCFLGRDQLTLNMFIMNLCSCVHDYVDALVAFLGCGRGGEGGYLTVLYVVTNWSGIRRQWLEKA